MKELKFEELSLKQKLGMTFTAVLHGPSVTEEGEKFVHDLIKERALGAIWVQEGFDNTQEQIDKVKAIADYPILIVTDCESGIKDYRVGKHNAIGCTGSEKHAYAFGKAVGVTANNMGYNVVCNPVVDLIDGSQRSMGTDEKMVSKLAVAEGKGMHDGGVLTIAKHYPGGSNIGGVDSHMAESCSDNTKEELLNYYLKPYLAMDKEGVLDGIMVGHKRMFNIDPDHPSSLSKPVMDIIREQGFNGCIMTDALCMMGIRAKFGDVQSKGLAVSGGVDLLLPYTIRNEEQFNQYMEAYEKGLVDDEMLDVAVKRVLEMQHKVTLLPKNVSLTEDEEKTFKLINKDGVYTKIDDGVSTTISKDGKHYFVMIAKQETDIAPGGKVAVDTFSNGWHFPARISNKIKELFPNSEIKVIHQFPSQGEMMHTLNETLGYDEVIFMTFSEALAYTGREHLTRRIENLIEAMQFTNRISTVIHFGNPHVLETLPHIPRYIFGGQSAESVDTTLEVLAGDYPANGVPTYKADLK